MQTILSIFLSAICCGAGFVYAGRPKLGVIANVIGLLLISLAYWLSALLPAAMGATAYLVFLVAGFVFVFVQAIGSGWWIYKYGVHPRPRRGLETFGFLVVALALILLNSALMRKRVIEPYLSPTESMLPLVKKGDRFLVKRWWKPSDLKAGTVVTFRRDFNGLSSTYIKRIVGAPGDTVDVRPDCTLMLNGKAFGYREVEGGLIPKGPVAARLAEETIRQGLSYQVLLPKVPGCSKAQFKVKDGELVVMGDNRPNSYDSRAFGTVPIASVEGVPTAIWFSWPNIFGHVINAHL